MKKTKPIRSLPAACSTVALSAGAYGCDSGPSQSDYDELGAALTAGAGADGDQPVLTTERSTGGAANGTARWTATIHGGGEATDAALPMAAIGTFNAHIGAAEANAMGRLQGAFGST